MCQGQHGWHWGKRGAVASTHRLICKSLGNIDAVASVVVAVLLACCKRELALSRGPGIGVLKHICRQCYAPSFGLGGG